MSKIILKKSSVTGKAPTISDLDYGEVALNYKDGKIYYKKTDGINPANDTIDSFSAVSAVAGVSSVDGNTGAITPSQLLTAISKVDGVGSGLDADLLDGYNSSTTDVPSTVVLRDAASIIAATGLDVTTGNSTYPTRRISWDDTEGTFDMQMYNGVTLQAGQELHFYGKASAGVTAGQVVMFTGAQGNHATFAPADYSSTIFSTIGPEIIMGVATSSAIANDYAYVTWFGKVNDLDTSAWAPGTILYFDPSVVGGLTPTAPAAPNKRITIAAVLRQHATQGTLLIRPDFGNSLSKLHDVYAPTPAANDVLLYNNSNSRWENTQLQLGAHTVGNYVASITNGSYITGGAAGSEGAALTLAVDATSANTASKVVARDASGNFSAGTITAALSGNASTATTLQTARTINGVSFNGSANIVVSTAGTGITVSGTTISINTTVATLTGTQTLTNKSLTAFDQKLSTTTIANQAVTQTSIATTAQTAVDTFATTTYRSAKYLVQITQGTNYQVSEILVIHNGTTTTMTEYGVMNTGGSLATFACDVNTGNVRLLATMASATAATINIQRTTIVV